MNKNGMVTEIHTKIRKEPFTANYELVGKELGRGKFAVVKKCTDKATGKQYAAKLLQKRRKGADWRMDIFNEIAVLELAKVNPYVVGLHGVYKTNSEIIRILECAAGGEIFHQCMVDNDEAFTEKDVIRLANQILNGVAFLHRNNVVHLDLKPQNTLLTSARPLGDIRIVDFGLSRRMDKITEVREILGTPEYVAPEILNYEPISNATDMWSIGVLIYVMLTGESPFLGDDKQETFLNISQVNIDYSQDTFEGISSLAVDFIKSLLVKNPRNRATAEECLSHPWLNPHSHPHIHTMSACSLDEP
ncbi:Serine/threonine-protein kinase 17A [Ilyodon furcidens]|uniref:Serine/threonine-protein kinase 17A n=1 Tax=Ilyodon furcidens TaxID=33524 RepID=A0ABV0TDI1_9TELE